MVFFAVDQDRDSRVLTLFHAKARFKVDLVVEIVLFDKLLKGLDNVVGALDVTGTADTDT
jgi:hypothetical protein